MGVVPRGTLGCSGIISRQELAIRYLWVFFILCNDLYDPEHS